MEKNTPILRCLVVTQSPIPDKRYAERSFTTAGQPSPPTDRTMPVSTLRVNLSKPCEAEKPELAQ
jgi:hypothetical protein